MRWLVSLLAAFAIAGAWLPDAVCAGTSVPAQTASHTQALHRGHHGTAAHRVRTTAESSFHHDRHHIAAAESTADTEHCVPFVWGKDVILVQASVPAKKLAVAVAPRVAPLPPGSHSFLLVANVRAPPISLVLIRTSRLLI